MMALHLIGETLDKNRSHYGAATGKLVPLMRGIYVDAGDDIDAVVLRHAVRIARYLYPRAYLSAASAALLGPTRDGRLFLSGRRRQRTRLRGLEIVQTEAPPNPSLGEAILDDGSGEFRVAVSSVRQRFLEAFRLRSEHAASIDDAMRAGFAARLVEEYGTAGHAVEAVWALARANEWYREGGAAERYLLHRASVEPSRNLAALDLIVAWHGVPLGHLRHDGFEWRWKAAEGEGPALVRQTTPGALPPFISSLLPEGWLQQVLQDGDERALLRSGRRYISNVAIVEREADLAALPQDVLHGSLGRHSRSGVFTGRYAGPGRGEIEDSFERNLARLYARPDTPRLSGVQIKAPMHLADDGLLSPATDKPFTHVLKPAGVGGFEALPVVEWMAMTLGGAAGFMVPTIALVAMPDGLAPAFLVERFDIRTGPDDRRLLALEDMCSVLDLPTSAKYDSTMERVARAVRPLSTAPQEDLQILVRRALFAWLVADGDMHLKNMALLKVAEPGERLFRSVRLAPLYDAVTTRVFPGLGNDRLALKLNGRDDTLHRADFRALAATAGLPAAQADVAIDDVVSRLQDAIDRVAVPAHLAVTDTARAMVAKQQDICRARLRPFS